MSVDEKDNIWFIMLQRHFGISIGLWRTLRSDRLSLKAQYHKIIEQSSGSRFEDLLFLDLDIKSLPDSWRIPIESLLTSHRGSSFKRCLFPENYFAAFPEIPRGNVWAYLIETDFGDLPTVAALLLRNKRDDVVIAFLYEHSFYETLKELVKEKGSDFRCKAIHYSIESAFNFSRGYWRGFDTLVPKKNLQEDPDWEKCFYPLIEKEGEGSTAFLSYHFYKCLGPGKAFLGRTRPYNAFSLRVMNIEAHLDLDAQIGLLAEIDNETSLREIIKKIPIVWGDTEPNSLQGETLLEKVAQFKALRICRLLLNLFPDNKEILKVKNDLIHHYTRDLVVIDPNVPEISKKYKGIMITVEEVLKVIENLQKSNDFDYIFLKVMDKAFLPPKERKNPHLLKCKETALLRAQKKGNLETLERLEHFW